ncbi:glycoside hydrolase family 10 protein [Fimbriiglobus ruber]|uniref:Putative glycoside hydrolase n=1 Tax=Fimbriiglobus ruber TaxID=1908690 RepID=A0A225DF73_9BACT|nr:family 10 glycosylhydrolase [Fimbriiglobus ruber]OWK35045.1 putative glycoside hydrolase [Fimbriiglobus ruber]
MTRLFFGILASLGFFVATAPAADGPPPLAREFRGVWVATVGNIDWPSRPGLPAEKQKAELLAILDKAVELHLNAVIFQVRPMADALYESKLEPWSEYLTGTMGKGPGYDPLAFAVAEAHARGLELHAWFNPYRARHPSAKSVAPDDHITKRRPDLAKPYGTHYWMNPTHPDVQEHSLAVVLDVVKRYDVDGVHIDDYFYPYKEKNAAGAVIPFPDNDTWEKYQAAGGKAGRDDWRRAAVNQFVERMYKEVKAAKPWVKVGISPFGVWRPGNPPGIAGLDQYAELYADAKLWLNEGWVDYFAPQLYWRIAQEKQSFPKLLAWWAGENAKKRHLWPGLYTGRVTGTAKGWPAKEIVDQIEITRTRPDATGAIHFSAKTLVRNAGGVADELRKVYASPALVPASPWLATGLPPKKPKLVREIVGDQALLRIETSSETRFVMVRTLSDEKWTTTITSAVGEKTAIPVSGAKRVVVSVLDRTGRESEAAE